ncbi:hypothetical protein AC579_8834 [Pseudocercospora musae]|uniref:Uncharacterized protein n=1 Tax=Pseudocercospora musae TaxID=113226 RepID=A0A139HDP4_9PEZI|nr:hypothetical protein AC579_8834 [Pseudocercospora musae]
MLPKMLPLCHLPVLLSMSTDRKTRRWKIVRKSVSTDGFSDGMYSATGVQFEEHYRSINITNQTMPSARPLTDVIDYHICDQLPALAINPVHNGGFPTTWEYKEYQLLKYQCIAVSEAIRICYAVRRSVFATPL